MINKHTELCLAVKRPTRFKVTLFTRCSRSSLRNEEYIRCAFREDGEGKKPHFKKAQKKREREQFWFVEYSIIQESFPQRFARNTFPTNSLFFVCFAGERNHRKSCSVVEAGWWWSSARRLSAEYQLDVEPQRCLWKRRRDCLTEEKTATMSLRIVSQWTDL